MIDAWIKKEPMKFKRYLISYSRGCSRSAHSYPAHTFERQWRLDATGNWKAFNMEATEAIERITKMNAEGANS